MLFLQGYGLIFFVLLSTLAAKRKPTPGYCGASSIGTPEWAFWEKYGRKNRKTTLTPSW